MDFAQKQLRYLKTQYNKYRRTAANSRLPQWGLTWLNQVQYFYQHLYLGDSEVLRNPPLRQAAKRYVPFGRRNFVQEKTQKKLQNKILFVNLRTILKQDESRQRQHIIRKAIGTFRQSDGASHAH